MHAGAVFSTKAKVAAVGSLLKSFVLVFMHLFIIHEVDNLTIKLHIKIFIALKPKKFLISKLYFFTQKI